MTYRSSLGSKTPALLTTSKKRLDPWDVAGLADSANG